VLEVGHIVSGQEESRLFWHPTDPRANVGPQVVGDVQEVVDAGVQTGAIGRVVAEDGGLVGPVGWKKAHMDHGIVLLVVDVLGLGVEDGHLLAVYPGVGEAYRE